MPKSTVPKSVKKLLRLSGLKPTQEPPRTWEQQANDWKAQLWVITELRSQPMNELELCGMWACEQRPFKFNDERFWFAINRALESLQGSGRVLFDKAQRRFVLDKTKDQPQVAAELRVPGITETHEWSMDEQQDEVASFLS